MGSDRMQVNNQRSKDTMKKTFGTMIATLRKEKNLTQAEVAEMMGVTDKAVSKWERDLSFPDINSLPKLAELFDMTVDELMQVKVDTKKEENTKIAEMINLVCRGIALAMGIAVVVLSLLEELETENALRMLGLGLACLAISQFSQNKE